LKQTICHKNQSLKKLINANAKEKKRKEKKRKEKKRKEKKRKELWTEKIIAKFKIIVIAKFS